VNRTPREFLDTKVLVYAFTSDPRAGKAQELLARGCNTGVKASMNSPMWQDASSA
jgi:predicted nucleic acid-binding protein